MTIRQLVRRGIERARDRERQHPRVAETLTEAMRQFDARLPESLRPRETKLRCYRITGPSGRQCNEPLYQWPHGDGHLFCYEHGTVTR